MAAETPLTSAQLLLVVMFPSLLAGLGWLGWKAFQERRNRKKPWSVDEWMREALAQADAVHRMMGQLQASVIAVYDGDTAVCAAVFIAADLALTAVCDLPLAPELGAMLHGRSAPPAPHNWDFKVVGVSKRHGLALLRRIAGDPPAGWLPVDERLSVQSISPGTPLLLATFGIGCASRRAAVIDNEPLSVIVTHPIVLVLRSNGRLPPKGLVKQFAVVLSVAGGASRSGAQSKGVLQRVAPYSTFVHSLDLRLDLVRANSRTSKQPTHPDQRCSSNRAAAHGHWQTHARQPSHVAHSANPQRPQFRAVATPTAACILTGLRTQAMATLQRRLRPRQSTARQAELQQQTHQTPVLLRRPRKHHRKKLRQNKMQHMQLRQ